MYNSSSQAGSLQTFAASGNAHALKRGFVNATARQYDKIENKMA
jgi:hypothetical protein